MFHVSPVTCHVSPVTCHMLHVICIIIFFLIKKKKMDKVLVLVIGGSVTNGAYPTKFIYESVLKFKETYKTLCFGEILSSN